MVPIELIETDDADPATPTQAEVVALAGNTLTHFCHQAAYAAGWWTHRGTGLDLRDVVRQDTHHGPIFDLLAPALVSQKLTLIHSEISEAMEGHRKGLMDTHLPHRVLIEVELADAVIRIADLCGALGLNLGMAIAEKMVYNAQRADHKAEAREAAGGKVY